MLFAESKGGERYRQLSRNPQTARDILPFAVSKPQNDDSYTHVLRYPTHARLPPNFTPAVANSITALGAWQITVGSALNANGVTYDVWAIRTGMVMP
jgi:hypothetical protein